MMAKFVVNHLSQNGYTYLPTYLSVYLSIHPSIHPSIHLSIYLSIHPSIHPSILYYFFSSAPFSAWGPALPVDCSNSHPSACSCFLYQLSLLPRLWLFSGSQSQLCWFPELQSHRIWQSYGDSQTACYHKSQQNSLHSVLFSPWSVP